MAELAVEDVLDSGFSGTIGPKTTSLCVTTARVGRAAAAFVLTSVPIAIPVIVPPIPVAVTVTVAIPVLPSLPGHTPEMSKLP